MATSGSFSTNKYNNTVGLKLSWTSSKDTVNNRTRIYWTLTSVGGSSGYYWKAGPITVTIGGTKVLNVTSRFDLHGDGGYKKTGNLYINHNDDGTKSVSMSIKAAIYSTSVNCTGSKTYTLDKIDRTAYIISCDNFSDVSYPSINYANPLGSETVNNLKIRIYWSESTSRAGSTDWIDLDPNGGVFQFDSSSLTDADIQSLVASCYNSTTNQVTYELQSEMYGVAYSNKKTATFTVTNTAATISRYEYYDTNPVTKAVTGSPYTDLILGKSNVSAIISATPATGAKIQRLTILNLRTNISYSHDFVPAVDSLTDYEVELGVPVMQIDTAPNELTFDIEDTRGVWTKAVINNFSLFEWSAPYAQTKLEREDGFYSRTFITVNCTYSKIPDASDNPRNSVSIKCWYKKTSDESYDPSTETTLYDGVRGELLLNNSYSWNVLVAIKDEIGSDWISYEYTVGSGKPILFIDKEKKSVSVNCLPSLPNTLEVNGADVVEQYSTEERCVGFWIDGSPIYEKTVTLSSDKTIPSNSWTEIATLTENIKIISVVGYSDTSAGCYFMSLIAQYVTSTKKLSFLNPRSNSTTIDTYTMKYIKLP